MTTRLAPTPTLIKDSCRRLKRKTATSLLQSFHTTNRSSLLLSCSSTPRRLVRPKEVYQRPAANLRFLPTNSFHSTASHPASQDPYSTLGVKKDAPASEIKKAYYSLAKKYHPDINKEAGAKERYQNIQEAYDVLSDDKKRAAYDQFGPMSQQPGFDPNAFGSGAGFGAGGNPFGDMFGGDPGDMFSSLFGAFGGRSGSRSSQQVFVGDDLEASITIPFDEMAKGTSRSIDITPIVDCPPCNGAGVKSGAKPQTCRTCNGTGTMTFVVQSGFTMAGTCRSCAGSGRKVDEKDVCGSCGGIGKVRDRKRVDVKIPAGVEDGMKIKLSGQGDAPVGGGKGGRPGDLHVKVNVAPSKTFRRQGSNLYTQVKIPFHTALLGGTVRVPTLDKEVEVQVPRGTQPSEELVLKGRGVKHLYKEFLGDLIVKFNVTIPRSLSPEQRVALEAYVAATEGRPSSTSATGPSNQPPPESKTEGSPQEQPAGDDRTDKKPMKRKATRASDPQSAERKENGGDGQELDSKTSPSSSSKYQNQSPSSQDQDKTQEASAGDDDDVTQQRREPHKKASSSG